MTEKYLKHVPSFFSFHLDSFISFLKALQDTINPFLNTVSLEIIIKTP